MHSLVIVEDEQTIREALGIFIDWNKLGFTMVGSFSNGAEALNFLREQGANVILTDIRMPEMSGLELIQKVNELGKNVKTVILSGYDDFSYAQTALKFGVFDYILKPIDFRTIEEAFTRLKATLDSEWSSGLNRREAYKLKCEQFMNNLVKGMYENPNQIEQQANAVELVLGKGPYCIVRLEVSACLQEEAIIKDKELAKFSIRNILEEMTEHKGLGKVFENEVHEFCIFIYQSEDQQEIKALMEECIHNIYRFLRKDIVAGVSCIYQKLDYSSMAYGEAGEALGRRSFAPNTSVLLYYKNEGQRGVLDRVREFVNEHYSKDIGLEEVAALIHLNPSYFSRMFKNETGIGFSNYLASIRIQKASELLKDPTLKVYEIATMVGYADYKHFSEMFKKYTGLTPGDFREGNRK